MIKNKKTFLLSLSLVHFLFYFKNFDIAIKYKSCKQRASLN